MIPWDLLGEKYNAAYTLAWEALGLPLVEHLDDTSAQTCGVMLVQIKTEMRYKCPLPQHSVLPLLSDGQSSGGLKERILKNN